MSAVAVARTKHAPLSGTATEIRTVSQQRSTMDSTRITLPTKNSQQTPTLLITVVAIARQITVVHTTGATTSGQEQVGK